jgi:hypothetical protein
MPGMLFCGVDATIHSLNYHRISTKVQFAGITICTTGVEIPVDAGIRRLQRSRLTARAPSEDAGLPVPQLKSMSQGCRLYDTL